MADDIELEYFRQRAEKEEELAFRASSPAIKAIHQRLAAHYRHRVEEIEVTGNKRMTD